MHTFKWTSTSLGGFAQCSNCYIVNTTITEQMCVNYIDPKIAQQATKLKKRADLEKRKKATIEYLKSKGLPYS